MSEPHKKHTPMAVKVEVYQLLEEHLTKTGEVKDNGVDVVEYDEGWSDRHIADQCDIPRPIVANMRMANFGQLPDRPGRNIKKAQAAQKRDKAISDLAGRLADLEARPRVTPDDLSAITDMVAAVEERLAEVETALAEVETALVAIIKAAKEPEMPEIEAIAQNPHCHKVLKAMGPRLKSLGEIAIDAGLSEEETSRALDLLISERRAARSNNGRFFIPSVA